MVAAHIRITHVWQEKGMCLDTCSIRHEPHGVVNSVRRVGMLCLVFVEVVVCVAQDVCETRAL